MKSSDKIFINNARDILTGKAAEEKIKETNDHQFLTSDGILSVPIERWAVAQQFEESFWLCDAISAKEDRNYEHLKRFDNYKILEGKIFQNVIELGSGPFALNVKLLIDSVGCDVENLTLLDPLIYKYLSHPNCNYKNNIYKLVNSTIEEFETKDRYDLVIMINVLEHCFNINKVFEVINNILDRDGIFVFSEATVMSEHIKNINSNMYDPGHPIRITDKYLENFIESNYKILYKRVFDNLYDQDWRRDFYYILNKK